MKFYSSQKTTLPSGIIREKVENKTIAIPFLNAWRSHFLNAVPRFGKNWRKFREQQLRWWKTWNRFYLGRDKGD